MVCGTVRTFIWMTSTERAVLKNETLLGQVLHSVKVSKCKT
jgi:hypothetical protein